MALSTFTLLCNRHHHPPPELLHHPKWKLCTHQTPASTPLYPWQPPFYFLSLWFDYSRDLTSDIIQDVLFCDWLILLSMMPSRYIHVVACVRFHSILRLNNTPLCVYSTFCLFICLLMDTRVVSTFWLLWILLLWMSGSLLSIFLGICLGAELLDHMVILCLPFLRNWWRPLDKTDSQAAPHQPEPQLSVIRTQESGYIKGSPGDS